MTLLMAEKKSQNFPLKGISFFRGPMAQTPLTANKSTEHVHKNLRR